MEESSHAKPESCSHEEGKHDELEEDVKEENIQSKRNEDNRTVMEENSEEQKMQATRWSCENGIWKKVSINKGKGEEDTRKEFTTIASNRMHRKHRRDEKEEIILAKCRKTACEGEGGEQAEIAAAHYSIASEDDIPVFPMTDTEGEDEEDGQELKTARFISTLR